MHKSILGRSEYFAGCFRQPGWSENQENKISLPDPLEVVEVVLKIIYGFPMVELLGELRRKTFIELLTLHSAGDYYIVPELKYIAYNNWTLKFNHVKPSRGAIANPAVAWTFQGAGHQGLFVDTLVSLKLKRTEVDTKPFLQHVMASLAGGKAIFGLTQSARIAVYNANPALAQVLAAGRTETLSSFSNQVIFRALCSRCQEQWVWSKFATAKPLRCPCCGDLHTWQEFVAEAAVRLGW